MNLSELLLKSVRVNPLATTNTDGNSATTPQEQLSPTEIQSSLASVSQSLLDFVKSSQQSQNVNTSNAKKQKKPKGIKNVVMNFVKNDIRYTQQQLDKLISQKQSFAYLGGAILFIVLFDNLYKRKSKTNNEKPEQQGPSKRSALTKAVFYASGILAIRYVTETDLIDSKIIKKVLPFIKSMLYKRLIETATETFISKEKLNMIMRARSAYSMFNMAKPLFNTVFSKQGSSTQSPRNQKQQATQQPVEQRVILFMIEYIAKQLLKSLLGSVTPKRATVHHFSMIEILISISIIVTFSALAGTVYHKKYLESKVSYARIEMNMIQQALLLFQTRTGRFPLYLDELYEAGDLSSARIKTDPWGQDYIYIPHVDWARLVQILESSQQRGGGLPPAAARPSGTTDNGTKPPSLFVPSTFNERELKYYVEAISILASTLSKLPEGVSPSTVLAVANDTAFVMSLGQTQPIFPADIIETSEGGMVIDQHAEREKVKQIMQFVRMAREKAVGNLALQQAIDSLSQQVK